MYVSPYVTVGLLHCVRFSLCHSGSIALCTCLRMSQWVYCTVYVSPYVTVGLLHCVRVSVSLSGSIALCACLRKSQWVLHVVCGIALCACLRKSQWVYCTVYVSW